MKKLIADSLREKMPEVREVLDQMCRGSVRQVRLVVNSETTATATFEKVGSGRRVIVFLYWVNLRQGGRWWYLLPTYSHVQGMARLADQLFEVEQANFLL
jgi:hypothetical protein